MIVAQLEKDVEHLDDMSVQRLIWSYITKIYAYGDNVSITGGVNMVDCGGRIGTYDPSGYESVFTCWTPYPLLGKSLKSRAFYIFN